MLEVVAIIKAYFGTLFLTLFHLFQHFYQIWSGQATTP